MEEKNNIINSVADNVTQTKNSIEMPKIVSVGKFLAIYNLVIPEYQRPYKWTRKNIFNLLQDIQSAIVKSEEIKKHGKEEFKYRLGTIILHKEKESDKYNIVDGQQRVISLLLITKALERSGYHISVSNIKSDKIKGEDVHIGKDKNSVENELKFCPNIFNHNFYNNDSKVNIFKNYKFIESNFLNKEQDDMEKFIRSLFTTLEVVVITVSEVSEAFQLFDSQNSRGKALLATDLLKPFHLRAIQQYNDDQETQEEDKNKQIKEVVDSWESVPEKNIYNLYNKYLFPILNWSKQENTFTFTSKNFDFYKGVPNNLETPYSLRLKNISSTKYFIMNEPFIEGSDFFEMTKTYLKQLKTIDKEIEKGEDAFENIDKLICSVCFEREYRKWSEEDLKKQDINKDDYINQKYINVANNLDRLSKGFRYAFELFKCALLFYYNKFENFNTNAVKKLFVWAMTIRLINDKVSFDSINKYAIKENIQAIDFYSDDQSKSSLFYELAKADSSSAIDLLSVDDSLKSKKTADLISEIDAKTPVGMERKSLGEELEKLLKNLN